MQTQKGQSLNPRWALTRRVAYDAEEEDDQLSSHTETAQRAPQASSLLIKPTRDLARNNSRSNDTPSNPHRRIRISSARTTPSKSKNRVIRSETEEKISAAVHVDSVSERNEPVLSESAKDWRDDWIILTPGTVQNGIYGKWIVHSLHHQEFVPDVVQPRSKRQRTRQPKKSKPKTTFADLPPEIRNTIYEYTIPERVVLILRTHPTKEARKARKNWTPEYFDRKPVKCRLTHDPERGCTSEDFSDAVNLILSSKKIKTEVESFFYSRMQFSFFSLKALRQFLRTAPKVGVESIRKAYILQDGYGNAEMSENQKYRGRYYQNWEDVCTLLGQKASSLRHLKLEVNDREWPCMLSGKDYDPAWKASVLRMAPDKIPRVEVRIHHRMVDKNRAVLKDLARSIEDSMMTQNGRDERDRIETEQVLAELAHRKAAKQEKERKKRAKLNAPTELVISMEDIQKSGNRGPTKNKVRSKGLDKFSKAEPDFCCALAQYA